MKKQNNTTWLCIVCSRLFPGSVALFPGSWAQGPGVRLGHGGQRSGAEQDTAPAPRAWRASSNTDQKTSNHRTLSRGHSRPLPAPITSPNLLMRGLPAPGAWLLGNQCSRAGGKNAGLGPRRLGSGPGFPGLGGLRYKTRNGLGLSFLRTSQVGSQPPREQQEGKTLAVLNKTTPYRFILFF